MIDSRTPTARGVMELEGADAALAAGARLLAAARAAGTRIVHIVNDGGRAPVRHPRADRRHQPGGGADRRRTGGGEAGPERLHDTTLETTLRDLDAGED